MSVGKAFPRVFLVGFMGSGKTSVARALAARLEVDFFDTDRWIESQEGRSVAELFELRGVEGRRGDAGGELILHPTEDHVMRLAHLWSLDPTTLHAVSAQAGLGMIAIAPPGWRAERARKIA